MTRRSLLLTAFGGLALLGLLPPVGAEEPGEGAAQAPVAEATGSPAFTSFAALAQGQVANLIGFFGGFEEQTRMVGALTELSGPPGNSRNIAAFFQRGEAGTFIYGVIGGPGGARGTLPDPPPGEANAFYPAEPYETTFEGPVTTGAGGQVVDGRFHAKATEAPTGRSEAMITRLSQEGQFTVEQAVVVSHSEPVESGGIQAESVSVLRGIAAGPLLIEQLVSRASALVLPDGSEPRGIASTVVTGATVNGTAVKITDKGIVAADGENPLGQEQLNAALAEGGFDAYLLSSTAEPGENNASVRTVAGALRFVRRDPTASDFQGGGFALGGAAASVSTVPCAPNCPDLGLPADPPFNEAPVQIPPAPTASAGSTAASAQPVAPVVAGPGLDTTGAAPAVPDLGSTAGFGSTRGLNSGAGPGSGGIDYGSSIAVTPPDLDASAVTQTAAPAVRQSTTLAAALGPEDAGWVRDLYLGLGVGIAVLLAAQRVIRLTTV